MDMRWLAQHRKTVMLVFVLGFMCTSNSVQAFLTGSELYRYRKELYRNMDDYYEDAVLGFPGFYEHYSLVDESDSVTCGVRSYMHEEMSKGDFPAYCTVQEYRKALVRDLKKQLEASPFDSQSRAYNSTFESFLNGEEDETVLSGLGLLGKYVGMRLVENLIPFKSDPASYGSVLKSCNESITKKQRIVGVISSVYRVVTRKLLGGDEASDEFVAYCTDQHESTFGSMRQSGERVRGLLMMAAHSLDLAKSVLDDGMPNEEWLKKSMKGYNSGVMSVFVSKGRKEIFLKNFAVDAAYVCIGVAVNAYRAAIKELASVLRDFNRIYPLFSSYRENQTRERLQEQGGELARLNRANAELQERYEASERLRLSQKRGQHALNIETQERIRNMGEANQREISQERQQREELEGQVTGLRTQHEELAMRQEEFERSVMQRLLPQLTAGDTSHEADHHGGPHPNITELPDDAVSLTTVASSDGAGSDWDVVRQEEVSGLVVPAAHGMQAGDASHAAIVYPVVGADTQ